jgi:hypothetical protein
VATFNMTHGMEQLYRASSGALYLGAVGAVHRSLDNGRTWADTGAQSTSDGYGGLVGDGARIWTMIANTGLASAPVRWQVLPEANTTSSPANPAWQFSGSTTYPSGPNHLIFDPINRVLYSSNWGAGLWRMKLP